MHFTSITLASSLALLASAVPHQGHGYSHQHSHLAPRSETFALKVTNNCATQKTFGLFQITGDFQMIQKSQPMPIPSGGSNTMQAPYRDLGMRLSATADQGPDAQWDAQALFEFGWGEYMGAEGTAYDLSFMEGCDPDIGILVTPDNSKCSPKSCYPDSCSASDAWTNENQIDDGSPADTVCYEVSKV
ncbi:hypothetical protein LTR37_000803 [Vermiconidia calcicola]|uniref:Uncharacterized protein n=1 Tax=Vermiconidia calcicola TaxID=1690605 RepID=A0ACC3NWU3_9PEZI|nr:hypothetical protein LTR37_000803 [Vermiconidia calcicola]